MQCIIFRGQPEDVEERVNQWLRQEERDAVDILQSVSSDGRHELILTIFYNAE